MERGNEEGVHNTAKCRVQAEATPHSSRWSLATQWRGDDKDLIMQNVEPASILYFLLSQKREEPDIQHALKPSLISSLDATACKQMAREDDPF